MTVAPPAAPLLRMTGIAKAFPGVKALDGVTFDVNAGEVHALVGENGAGKSTLMKILAGAQPADAGEIVIDGTVVAIDGPKAAERLGIGMIYQEFNLVPDFGVVENIVLGNEPRRGVLLDRAAAHEQATRVLADLGIALPLDVPARRLTVAQQQLTEIAKALARHARLIVMDEPTAALTEREIDALFGLIGKLKAQGVAFVYISHRLEELPRIADRITVLRDGKAIETRPIAQMPQDEMIRLMVGRSLEAHFPEVPPVAPDARVVLDVKGLSAHGSVPVHDVTFSVRAGEVVGLAGLVGAGRTDIVRAIAGADIPTSGEIAVEGKRVIVRSPHDAIAAGIALITEDRKAQGLVLGMSVRENTTLASLKRFVRGAFVDRSVETATTNEEIAELRIRTPSSEQIVRNLSGGNQQKVVLAKWLVDRAHVFLFDEPTRGIDVGAKAEIYALMVELLQRGAAIVMVSSELPEVLGMSHRVLVVRGGRIQAELARGEATSENVIAAAAAVKAAPAKAAPE
ncbi:ribose import ATP-binding protein RbsA 2 [Vulcanimicrobium alpinum]|uniref:Ribose import ATP-binding protein RbsA 2 n=1 Tax=Vulcanimicrobium alpinum TaxID=3016050 RepID=A0AAN2C8H7_UNVUL|nr:sugar ABC transporter ATP-binding protein [Vulcanimicrobium alpinum]BDE05309.1 ribose import ATP-binding protein RbsA 2 [Vulcanimicrobium alpinum]